MMSVFDEDHSESEDRWITLGVDSIGILLVIIHTFESMGSTVTEVRMISARKANQQEIQTYQEAV